MPLQRRVPKRGFNNYNRLEYQVVNVADLQRLVDAKKLAGDTVDAAALYKAGAISKAAAPYKILGNGELKAKLNVEAHAFSKSAVEKIEAAGGSTKTVKV